MTQPHASQTAQHIGAVASAADVNVQTVRYYERRGLITPIARSPGGYRLYDESAVETVRFVKRAQTLGFSLAEIGDLLALRRGTGRNTRALRTMAAHKIAEIDARLHDLAAMRSALSELVEDCTCSDEREAEQCVILDTLEGRVHRGQRTPARPPSSSSRR